MYVQFMECARILSQKSLSPLSKNSVSLQLATQKSNVSHLYCSIQQQQQCFTVFSVQVYIHATIDGDVYTYIYWRTQENNFKTMHYHNLYINFALHSLNQSKIQVYCWLCGTFILFFFFSVSNTHNPKIVLDSTLQRKKDLVEKIHRKRLRKAGRRYTHLLHPRDFIITSNT